MNNDKEYMEMAVIAAESNIDEVTNQGVGAVIVKDGEIVGVGCRHIWLNFCGKEHKCVHAEHMAIMEAGDKTRGATIYVTMEPCKKRWNTSISWAMEPCCNHVIKAGIARVVIGSLDERFGREGKEELEKYGIKVDLCLDFEDRIKALSKNVKVAEKLKDEYQTFIKNNV